MTSHLPANVRQAYPCWKCAALRAYYYGSLPYRLIYRRWAARQGRVPVVVLFYHRVADDGANGWTTHPATFARQIEWLRAHCDLVSLAEAQRLIGEGHRGRVSVCITFDDGYSENCQHALPLLIRDRIPCTYFVTLKNILDGTPFAHDVACGYPLTPNSLEQIRALAAAGIEIGSHTYSHVDLGAVQDRQQLRLEVLRPRDELQRLLGRPVRYFALPFGLRRNMSRAVFDLARQGGYAGVCSAYGAYNLVGEDPFHIRRVHADDDLIRLKNWVTLDPRKLWLQWQSPEIPPAEPTAVEPAEAAGVRREEWPTMRDGAVRGGWNG